MDGQSTVKPKLSSKEQIEHLKSKGIKFSFISEEEAEKYLEENSNYYKLRAFRKSFIKYSNGENAGKYKDLDFAALKDLFAIDTKIRYVMLIFSLDVEHFEKVKLLKYITYSADDGYNIVSEYFNSLKSIEDKGGSGMPYTALINDINRKRDSDYCGGIIQKYNGNYPVWAFLEVISFGSFISFLKFCGEYFHENSFKDDFYLLRDVKRLRNAAAHNNCVIHNLKPNTSTHKTNYSVNRYLSDKRFGFSKHTRNNHMSNNAVRDIVTVIYAHRSIVTDKSIIQSRSENIKSVIDRFYKHTEYYEKNDTIMATFDFLKKVVDKSYN